MYEAKAKSSDILAYPPAGNRRSSNSGRRKPTCKKRLLLRFNEKGNAQNCIHRLSPFNVMLSFNRKVVVGPIFLQKVQINKIGFSRVQLPQIFKCIGGGPLKKGSH